MAAVGRLAPTPSGVLHLGNAAAFAAAWLSARAQGGRVLLRVEDVDVQRADPRVAEAIRVDLAWLGFDWDEEVPNQATRRYGAWLAALPDTYFCGCSRREVAGGPYSGRCRGRGLVDGAVRMRLPDGAVTFRDRRIGARTVDPVAQFGDPVLKRRDGLFTYNLAVVVDDLRDGVTEVVRGADLLDYCGAQVRLWQAFGATPPTWLHAPLVVGPDGKKLSKSHGASGVGALRDAGWQPADVWRGVLPWLGLDGVDSLAAAVGRFDAERLLVGAIRLREEPATQRPTKGLSWESLDKGWRDGPLDAGGLPVLGRL